MILRKINMAAGFFGKMWGKVKNAASATWDGIKNVGTGIKNFFVGGEPDEEEPQMEQPQMEYSQPQETYEPPQMELPHVQFDFTEKGNTELAKGANELRPFM